MSDKSMVKAILENNSSFVTVRQLLLDVLDSPMADHDSAIIITIKRGEDNSVSQKRANIRKDELVSIFEILKYQAMKNILNV